MKSICGIWGLGVASTPENPNRNPACAGEKHQYFRQSGFIQTDNFLFHLRSFSSRIPKNGIGSSMASPTQQILTYLETTRWGEKVCIDMKDFAPLLFPRSTAPCCGSAFNGNFKSRMSLKDSKRMGWAGLMLPWLLLLMEHPENK